MGIKVVGMAGRLKTVRGFTLIEMMIVVAILSLLVMVAVPNFLDWNRKYKLKDAVGLVHGNMNIARMNAINQNTTVTVTVCGQGAACPLSPSSAIIPPYTPTRTTVFFRTATGNYIVQALTLDSEVSLTNAANAPVGGGVNSPQDIQFNSMGLRSDTGNANNLCINTATGAGVACAGSTAQAFNFMNTIGHNYRIVVTQTGKVSWCYAAACGQ
jgi:prepilin-type N-terminal cleavage/methylation domain-containing protein